MIYYGEKRVRLEDLTRWTPTVGLNKVIHEYHQAWLHTGNKDFRLAARHLICKYNPSPSKEDEAEYEWCQPR